MEIARGTDLPDLLASLGYTVTRIGRYYSTKEMDSLRIKNRRTWYRYSERVGGDAITFLQHFCGRSFPEAVEDLLAFHGRARDAPAERSRQTEQAPEPPKPFALPPRHADARRVYAYLMKHRHIDRDVITHFARAGLLYEDETYHNVVFVGKDETGTARHAHKRSTNSIGKAFRQNVEGSDPRYSFHHLGRDGNLFVFEAPIDLLSYLTLYPEKWNEHSYVACCGTSPIPVLTMLQRMKTPQSVYLCLDNDHAGHEASLRMAEQIGERFNIASDRLTPEQKDWNDDLCVLRETPKQGLAMGMR